MTDYAPGDEVALFCFWEGVKPNDDPNNERGESILLLDCPYFGFIRADVDAEIAPYTNAELRAAYEALFDAASCHHFGAECDEGEQPVCACGEQACWIYATVCRVSDARKEGAE